MHLHVGTMAAPCFPCTAWIDSPAYHSIPTDVESSTSSSQFDEVNVSKLPPRRVLIQSNGTH